MRDAVLVVLLGLIVPTAFFLGGAWVRNVVECSDIHDQSGKWTKYSVWSGCYVQVGGEWVPLER